MRSHGREIKEETSGARKYIGRQSHQQKAMSPVPFPLLIILSGLGSFCKCTPASHISTDFLHSPKRLGEPSRRAMEVVGGGGDIHLTVGNLVK